MKRIIRSIASLFSVQQPVAAGTCQLSDGVGSCICFEW